MAESSEEAESSGVEALFLLPYALLIGLPVVLVEVFKEWRPLKRTPAFLESMLIGLLCALLVALVTSVVAPFLPDKYAGGADLTVFLLGVFTLIREIGVVWAKRRDAAKLRRLYGAANTLCRRMSVPVAPERCTPAFTPTAGYDTTYGVLEGIGKPPDASTRHWLQDRQMIPLSARLEDFDPVEGCELRHHLAALFLVSMTYCGSLHSLAGSDVRVIASVAMENYRKEDKKQSERAAGTAGGLLGQAAGARRHGCGCLGGLRTPARLSGAAAEDPPVLAPPAPVQVHRQDPYQWLGKTQEVLSFAVLAAGNPSWTQMHKASAIYDHTAVSRFERDGNTGLLAAAQRQESKLSELAAVAAGARVESFRGKETFMNVFMGRIEYDSLVLAMELTAMSDYLSCTQSKVPLAATLGKEFFTQPVWQALQKDARDVRADAAKQEVWLSWFALAVQAVPTLLYLAFHVLCGYIPIAQGAEMLALCLRAHLERHMNMICQTFEKHEADADATNKIPTFEREEYECAYSLKLGLTTWGWSHPLDSVQVERKKSKVMQCNEVEFQAAVRLLKVVVVHVGDVFSIKVQEHVSVMDGLIKPVGQVDAGAAAKQQNGDGGADGGGAPRGPGYDPLGTDPDLLSNSSPRRRERAGDIAERTALAAGNSSSGGPSVRIGGA